MTTLPEVEYRVLDVLTPGETLSLEELIRRIGERDKTTEARVLAIGVAGYGPEGVDARAPGPKLPLGQ